MGMVLWMSLSVCSYHLSPITFQQLWTSKRINLNSVSKSLTFNKNIFEQCRSISFACNFVAHARLGVVLCMHILTLWFLPSFAHYFMKPSAALDSIRINFNSVEENLTFNALFCPCTAWRGSEHVFQCCLLYDSFFRMQLLYDSHGWAWFCECTLLKLILMLSHLIWRTFQQLWTASIRIQFMNSVWKSITFNLRIFIFEVRSISFAMQFCCHARLGVVLCMHILTLWFLPSFAHYFKNLTTALDSKGTNFDSAWRKCNFQCRIFWTFIRLGWFWCNFVAHWMILNLSPIILRTFQQLWTKRTNLNSVEKV